MAASPSVKGEPANLPTTPTPTETLAAADRFGADAMPPAIPARSLHSGSWATFASSVRFDAAGWGRCMKPNQSLDRRVALKVLRFGTLSDPDTIERFQREAETVARLHHTHLVPVFALGGEHGVNDYAMQFIAGKSLDQVLRQHIEQDQRLPQETVVQWGLQVAEAWAHAHARNIIHRDIKPSDLLAVGYSSSSPCPAGAQRFRLFPRASFSQGRRFG